VGSEVGLDALAKRKISFFFQQSNPGGYLLVVMQIFAIGFDSQRGLGIFLFTTAALGPTQPPIQRVSGALSLGIKRPEREADHSPPSSAEVKE
jgi:hypothetical protein